MFGAHIPTNSKEFKSSIEAFSRVIAASPHLLGYVRCLHLHGSPYPLVPRLPPNHTGWLNSQSPHLMTFLPRVAPRLKGFGMHLVDWKTLLPEVMTTIAGVFESGLLTSVTLINTTNLPVSVLASCERLQHLNLQVEGSWASAALAACRVSKRCQWKRRLISLKLRNSKSDWFSRDDCIFDISHLRYLDLFGQLDFARVCERCSGSLRVLHMEAKYLPDVVVALNDINSFTVLEKAYFHLSAGTSTQAPISSEPRKNLSRINDLLRHSHMPALKQIILDCAITYKSTSDLLVLFSEMDSILAAGTQENLPALQSVTILVDCNQRYKYKVIGMIMKRMRLLHKMGIVRVIRGEDRQLL